MNRKFWITLALLALVVPTGFAFAQTDGKGWGRHGEWTRGGGPGLEGPGGRAGRHMRMLQHLDLSDRQKEQIKELREANKSERLQLRKEINRLRNQLHGEMLADRPDKRRVLALAGEIDDVRSKLHLMTVEQWLDMRALLTDEQRDELLAMPRFGRGGHGRHGKMGRGGPRGLHRMMMELHEGNRDSRRSQ